MADAFAPQLSSEVRFNQPVETPSTLGTLAGLASTFVGSFADAQRGSSRASSGADPNLAVFQQGLERVEAVRQERGEAAAQIVERRLAANFAAQGISFGQDYEDVYTKTTGRPWAGYGMDVEANMLQEAMKDSQVQASYIASFAVNKDWNEEQRIEYAIGQKAQMTAMENEITRSKTEANYKWTTQSESAYTGAVDTFVNTTFGAMSTAVMSGGRVGPQDIANVQAQWAQLKMNLTRPAGISDDQWKAVQDKFTAVDNTLTAMEKAGSNEVLLNEITSAFARQILDAGDGSPESALAAMTALKDPASLANLQGMGPKILEFMNTIGKAEPLDIATTDLFGHIVSDGGGVSPTTDPNAFLNDIPSEAKARVEGKTPQQIYDGLEASGQLTAIIRPNDLNRVEAREQFTENAAAIGMVMQGTGNDKFLSNDFLKKLVANPGFIRNIQTLDTLDPEAATVARTYVRSGLNVELNKQQRNLEAIESSLGVRWNGNAYVLDRQGLMDKNGWTEQQTDGFIAWVGRTYGGDLKRLADGTTPMPAGMNFQPGGLQQAYDRRAAITTINQTLDALAVPVEEGQQPSVVQAPASNYRIPEEVSQDQEFIGAVNTLASDFNIAPDDIYRAIEFETAGSWSPSIRNPNGSATGLIQFLESTARGLGTSTAELASMTRGQQMEYVRRYLEPYKGRIKNFGDLYMAIHWPAGIGKDETYVMYRSGTAAYDSNRNLDTNGDGTVTRGETIASVISRTGGGRGVMTTPATGQTQAFAAEAAQDIQSAAPPGGFQMDGSAPTAPVAPAPAASDAATAEMPTDFSGVDLFNMDEGREAQTPAVNTQVAAAQRALADRVISTLEPKTLRQLRRLGVDPATVDFFETDAEAEAAIASGDLAPGDAYVLPDGSVRVVEED